MLQLPRPRDVRFSRHPINLLLYVEHHIAHPDPRLLAAVVQVLLHPGFERGIPAKASFAKFNCVCRCRNAGVYYFHVVLEPLLCALEQVTNAVIVHHCHGRADDSETVDLVSDILRLSP